jgi:AcrR family transcriptional regulator
VDDEVPWWPHRPARRGAPAEPVTEERIVETALELLGTDDSGDVSIRRIATALGVSRATVYWWVGSRPRLVALVAEAVHSRIALPRQDDPRPWIDQLRELATGTHYVYARYPGAHTLLSQGVLAGPRTLHLLDAYLTLLLGAGFSPEEAVRAWRTITYVIFGSLAETSTGQRDETTWTAGQGLSSLPADTYAGLTATAEILERPDAAAFPAALETVLQGLAARAGAPA